MESIRNIRCVYVCGCVIAAIAETKIFIFLNLPFNGKLQENELEIYRFWIGNSCDFFV